MAKRQNRGSIISKYADKPDQITVLEVFKPVNDLLWKALDCPTYSLIKRSAWYDEDVAHELHRMAKRTAAQMNDRTFSGRDPMSVIAFLQDLRTTCDVCRI